MSYLDEILAKYPPIRKKGIVSYSSKFFAASTIATLATLSYCITDAIIYGFKFNRHLSMLMLFLAAFAAASLMLVISYGVFKYSNKRSDGLKEAVKISNRKIASISGKIFAAALAISVTSLACTLITSAINGQDSSFLSLVRETFGFSSNGAWIGGSGGLLLCFLASSFVVFAISGLMHHYSKDKSVSLNSRYDDASRAAYHTNSNSHLDEVGEVTSEKGKKKNFNEVEKEHDDDQDRSSTASDATVYNDPWDQSKTYAVVNALLKRRNSVPNSCNYDYQLGKINDTFKKLSDTCEQQAKSLKQEEHKPVAAPRRNLSNQANNNTDFSRQEAELLKKQGNIAQGRRRKNLNSYSKPDTKITNVTAKIDNKDTEEEYKSASVRKRVEDYEGQIKKQSNKR